MFDKTEEGKKYFGEYSNRFRAKTVSAGGSDVKPFMMNL
jgi:hypothetical protein